MSSSIGDDRTSYLPPHELRALGANLVDREDTRAPGPSIATTSSPGLATAAASPTAHGVPAFSADDPGTLALALARVIGEPLMPMSLVPVPAPERVLSELGLAGAPISPGISPELAAATPAGAIGHDPVAPTLEPARATSGDPMPSYPTSQSTAGMPGTLGGAPSPTGLPTASIPAAVPPLAAPTHVPSNPLDALGIMGTQVRVPFMPGAPTSAPDLASSGSSVEHIGLFGADPASLDRLAAMQPGATSVPLVDSRDAPATTDRPAPTVTQQPTSYTGEPSGLSRGATDNTATDSVVRQAGGVAFDPYLVRRDFPILEERVHGGKRLVWLDNAATTQKPRAVIDRLTYYYEHENSNVHRAAHTMAARATEAFESARESTRKFLNASSSQEIIFVRGATEGINLIAKSLGKRMLERGDEIVLTNLEHHANIVPWQQLCAETGAKLRVAPVDDRGDVILEAYERLLCSRTKIVSFTQVSNALGTITPAKEMIASAHRWGATVVLDGAQAVSHMPVDVQDLDCDFYVFSGHKVFAPTGIGAVYGKRAVLEDMPPWQSGGNMIADVTFEKTVYQAPPWRFEAGTGNIADAAGLGAALEYVMRIGMPTIDRYEHELLAYAHERLAIVPGLHWIGTPRNKAGVLSFVLDGQRTEDVGSALDKHGIAVRSGHHCAQPILRRFGVEASVRASLAFYNVREDIDALTEALLRLQAASV